MHQNSDKTRQIAFNVLQDFDPATQTRQFIKALAAFLEIQEAKAFQKNILAEKIIYIHDCYRGQYDVYLTQPKFKMLNSEAKDFLWTTFKQYDQILNKLKYMASAQPKPMHIQGHMPPVMPSSTSQNMNMNMVNMFVDVPNLQTIEEIQMFQRKMFQIYKNVLPQVLNSIPMSSNQSQFYRNHPYQQQQYGMGGMSGMPGNMPGMSSMSGIPGMSSVQTMSGLGPMGGMAGMAGIGGLGAMGGMTNPNLGGMNSSSSMVGLSSMSNVGYNSKQSEYYQSVSNPFPNRYYYQNKGQNNFGQPIQNPPKNMPTDFRNNPMQGPMQGMGFNFCGERLSPDEYNRGYAKGMPSYSQGKINYMPEQYERKAATQKYLNIDDQKYDLGYQSYSPNEHSQLSMQKQFSKFVQKEKQKQKQKQKQINNSSQLPSNHEPRKMVKRDDEVSIFNDEVDSNSKSQNIACICNQKEKDEICYYCECVEMDPLNQVEEVLKIQKITPEKTKIVFNVDKKNLEKVHRSPDRLDIEIRCIKMEKQSEGQVCWPQKYRLSIDEEVIEEHFSPQTNKKRKDKPFVLSKYFGNQKHSQESLQICLEIKRCQDKTEKNYSTLYLFGIFVVVKHTIQKMYEKIMNKMPIKNVQEFFKKEGSQTQQNQIIVSPYQPSIKKLIKDPIRGKNCTHAQCFDLEVYLSFLIISPNRQWKCPICGKDAKQFVIDNQQKAVLADIPKMIKEPKQIVFYPNGSHILKYEQEKQAQEDKEGKKQKASQLG